MFEHGAQPIERQKWSRRKRSRGFTLMEVLFAIVILSVGVMGLAMVVPFATQNDYRTRVDTTATFVALRQLEQILAQPPGVVSFTDGSDNPGLNAPIVVNVTDLNTADLVGSGAPLDADGNIDFTVAQGVVAPGYARIYGVAPTPVNPNGNVRVNIGRYDVRWNIYQNANGIKTVTVAAQLSPLPAGANFLPANVRAVQMR